jgi:hypothetical protein
MKSSERSQDNEAESNIGIIYDLVWFGPCQFS